MEITRPRTEVEKDVKSGGFLDIRHWKQNDFYQKAIVEIDNAYNKSVHEKRIPYSRTMALDHLNLKVAEVERIIKKARDTKQEQINIDLRIDWSKFGGFDKFTFIKEEDTVETMINSGVKQQSKTGIHREYKCKTTGCGIAIFFSNKEIEQGVHKKNDGNSNTRKLPETQNPISKD